MDHGFTSWDDGPAAAVPAYSVNRLQHHHSSLPCDKKKMAGSPFRGCARLMQWVTAASGLARVRCGLPDVVPQAREDHDLHLLRRLCGIALRDREQRRTSHHVPPGSDCHAPATSG